jgi:protein TonB
MGMHATFDQLGHPASDTAFIRVRAPEPEPSRERQPAAEPPVWQPAGGYARRPIRPAAVVGILVAHVAVIGALIQFDVIEIHKKKADPLVVTLMPEQVAPPPAPPEEKLKPIEPVKPQIVAPAPVVVVPQPAPVAIATVREVPPPQAVVATAPAPAAPPGPPAPITPPDASAASLKNPAPRYPLESRRKREEGTVRLRVVITADGRVKAISVAKSSGFERLDEAALETVAKWKFKPGEQAGAPVEAVGFLLIPFKLTN